MAPPDPPQLFRFLDFDLDVAGHQLRRNPEPVRLGRQPMDLPILLVASRQRLVTRAESVDRDDPRFVALLKRCNFMRTARFAAPTQ